MPPALPLNPHLAKLAQRALVTAGPVVASAAHATHHYEKRGLSVNHTQGVTLGVIGAYVVVIALLWNLPYVRWVLWPFKVCDYFLVLEVGKEMLRWGKKWCGGKRGKRGTALVRGAFRRVLMEEEREAG